MTLREVYEGAILNESFWLYTLIDYLIFEQGDKTGIMFESDVSVLDKYLLEKNRERMNKLLIEYVKKQEENK